MIAIAAALLKRKGRGTFSRAKRSWHLCIQIDAVDALLLVNTMLVVPSVCGGNIKLSLHKMCPTDQITVSDVIGACFRPDGLRRRFQTPQWSFATSLPLSQWRLELPFQCSGCSTSLKVMAA